MRTPRAHEGINLVGKWFGRVDGTPVELEFKEDGRLAYVLLEGSRLQTILMVYTVEGDELITDQPSHPRQE